MVRRPPTSGARHAPNGGSGRITAVLGPTNTGKTHFAMERMLAHKTGMIGFPLRLLARENYDRAVRVKGERAVALVTGEEKIVPAGARYFLCTAEAMPKEHGVEFLAVDEVQLAADPERGHVFTERLQRARGRLETVFIGAETIRPVIRALAPEAEIVTRPRLSRLSYAGPKKVTRLPPRTAVIGFSAADVYALAELIRRRRGGAAVVLGALSPRTRNAQVALYQAGDVDYLVATDAIGMGLNMDIDHVMFSGLAKFDGRMKRRLSPAEIGQIAGRAGRHMNDGAFGTTAGCEALSPEAIAAVESHEFDPLRYVFWRNADLDLASLDGLLASLTEPPDSRKLVPARDAEDYRTLAALAKERAVRDAATTPDRVALLWDVCQIPDFRKVMGEAHVRLVGRIFADLVSDAGRISADWMARQVDRLDRTAGDIGTLVGRIADIRTWTYVSHHGDWVDDALHWQERTRRIEDNLSDALHERLTDRFVDRRTAVLVKRLREKEDLMAGVNAAGDVVVEGVEVGRLDGFRFAPAPSVRGDDTRAVRSAALRALRASLTERIAELEKASDPDLTLTQEGEVIWNGATIARLTAGQHILDPLIEPVLGEGVEPALRTRIERRLRDWFDGKRGSLTRCLRPTDAAAVSSAARAVLFQLSEAIGCIPQRQVADQLKALTKADRRQLSRAGVRLGTESVYLAEIYGASLRNLAAILWAVHRGRPAPFGGVKRPPHVAAAAGASAAACAALGYRLAGDCAVRADRLEKLAQAARKLARQGAFAPTPALAEAAGCAPAQLASLMKLLGFRLRDDGAGGRFERRRAKSQAGRGQKRPGANPCSPFAVLRGMAQTR